MSRPRFPGLFLRSLALGLALGLLMTRPAWCQPPAPVTAAQQEAVTALFREAVRSGSAQILEPLLLTAGMSIDEVAWNQQELPQQVRGLGRDPAALRFRWDPSISGQAGQEGQPGRGGRFVGSCTPVTTLRVEVAGQPGNVLVLPFCLEEGALRRMGIIRTPVE